MADAIPYMFDSSPTLAMGQLTSLVGNANPSVRAQAVRVCVKKWKAHPDIEKIFVSAIERFLRSARAPLTRRSSPSGSIYLGLPPEFEIGENGEPVLSEPFVGHRVTSLISGGGFLEEEFVALLERAWEVDPSKMNNVVGEMVRDGDPSKRLASIVLLANRWLRDRIQERLVFVEELMKDSNPLVKAEAERVFSKKPGRSEKE